MTTDELERALRAWLGLTPARFLPLPRAVLSVLAWLNEIIEVGPGDRELVELLERGNVANPAGVAAALGREPRSLAESFALSPATTADLWRARLYFVQPFLRITLALLWIGTGVASLGLFPPAESYVMLAEVGFRGPIAEVALFGGAAANLVLGGLLLVGWRPARIGMAMLALLAVYSLRRAGAAARVLAEPVRADLEESPDRGRLDRDDRDGAADRRRKTPVQDMGDVPVINVGGGEEESHSHGKNRKRQQWNGQI